MAFIRVKYIKSGNSKRPYSYLVENYREGGKVKQRVLEYLGSGDLRGQDVSSTSKQLGTTKSLRSFSKGMSIQDYERLMHEKLDRIEKIKDPQKRIKALEQLDKQSDIMIRSKDGTLVKNTEFSRLTNMYSQADKELGTTTQKTKVINKGLPPKTTGYHPYLGEDGYTYDFEVRKGEIHVVGVRDKNDKEIDMSIKEIKNRWGWRDVKLKDSRAPKLSTTTSKTSITVETTQYRYKSKYRGGTVTKPYVARITGKSSTYGLEREFLKGKDFDKDLTFKRKSTRWDSDFKRGEIIERKSSSGDRLYYMVWEGAGSSATKNLLHIPSTDQGDYYLGEFAEKPLKERVRIVSKEVNMQSKDPDETGNFQDGLSRFMYYDPKSGKRTEHTGTYFEREKPVPRYKRERQKKSSRVVEN